MDDTRELIDRLCTLAGMLMEDASAEAISIEWAGISLTSGLTRIRNSAADAATLALGALVVLRRSAELRM